MKLYSKRQFEELPDFATPEILRQPLDALCLQIMALKLGDPLEFLSLALEPPPPQSIESAMIRLFDSRLSACQSPIVRFACNARAVSLTG